MRVARRACFYFSRACFSSTGYKLLFPGQGSQYVGMTRRIPPSEGLDKLFSTAESILGYDARRLCLEGPEEMLNDTMYCQPAVVLASLASLEHLKVTQPKVLDECTSMAGLSVGEITALMASDALSLEEGFQLVKVRGEAMRQSSQEHPSGMITVKGLHIMQVKGLIDQVSKDHIISMATYLFPRGFVLAGTKEGLTLFKDIASSLTTSSIKDISVSGGFHSPLMSSSVPKLEEVLKRIHIGKPRFTLYSNVTGLPYDSPSEIRNLLVQQLTKPVLWHDVMKNMMDSGGEKGFIEVGPGKQLKVTLRSISREAFMNCQSVVA